MPWARVLRALLKVGARRSAPFLFGAVSWVRALRALVLAVLASIVGARIVANRAATLPSDTAAVLFVGYAVVALGPWLLAGLALGQGRRRPLVIAQAATRVLVVHALLLAAAVVAWVTTRLT